MSTKAIIVDLIDDIDVKVKITDESCFEDVFRSGSLGLGESYINGKWEACQPLDDIFTKIGKADLGRKLADKSWYIKVWLFFQWLYNYFTWQTRSSSLVVADQHYNLDPRLYDNMLSEDKMYSCAYFEHDKMTLHDAQIAKLDLIARKLQFRSGMRVLDIGCGWGFACSYFNKMYDVKTVGVTISSEQYNFAMENYARKGVEFFLSDYRDLGKVNYEFDAIYSIGMFEHVTSKHYREFMTISSNILKPDGLFLLHTIGRNSTNNVNDPFLDRYIFPNSALPSLSQISQSVEHLFIVEDVHNLGCHYDKTLMCWYNNFTTNINNLSFLSERFKRMWTYYLLSCAGTFRSRGCQLYQVVLSKQRYQHYERPNAREW